MKEINQQKQKVKGVQYNVMGNVTTQSNNSSEKSNKTVYLLTGAVLLVIIVALVAIVALKPNINNVTSGDNAIGIVHTGDGDVNTPSSKDSE